MMRTACIIFSFLGSLSVACASTIPHIPGQETEKESHNLHNGSAVPGDSPFLYHNDPTNDLFKIRSLNMTPNPCVIEAYCRVSMEGEFVSSLVNTTPHLSFNVSTYFDDGRIGEMGGEDDFCGWGNIYQEDEDLLARVEPGLSIDAQRPMKKTCPPRQGRAIINATFIVLGGWVLEQNYSFAVNVTVDDGKRTLFDLWTEFPFRYKNGLGMKKEETNVAGKLGEL